MKHLFVVMGIMGVLVVHTTEAKNLWFQEQAKLLKERFSVEEGDRFEVDLSHGDIALTPIEGRYLYVTVERDTDGVSAEEERELFERHDVAIRQDGRTVLVRARADRGSSWLGWQAFKMDVTLEAQVPRGMVVVFRTGAGNVEIEDLANDVEGRTGAGTVRVSDLEGHLILSTGAGNVEVAYIRGDAEISSGAGNVVAENITGRIRMRSGAGNVIYRSETLPTEGITLESGAGNVSLTLPESASIDVDASTSMGRASSDFSLRREEGMLSQRFYGSVNGGEVSIRLRSGVGNVTLRN